MSKRTSSSTHHTPIDDRGGFLSSVKSVRAVGNGTSGSTRHHRPRGGLGIVPHRTPSASSSSSSSTSSVAAGTRSGYYYPVMQLSEFRVGLHTDQQTLILGDMMASKQKLEEENQRLRDDLQDAMIMIQTLKMERELFQQELKKGAGKHPYYGHQMSPTVSSSSRHPPGFTREAALSPHLMTGNCGQNPEEVSAVSAHRSLMSSALERSIRLRRKKRQVSRREMFKNPTAPGRKLFRAKTARTGTAETMIRTSSPTTVSSNDESKKKTKEFTKSKRTLVSPAEGGSDKKIAMRRESHHDEVSAQRAKGSSSLHKTKQRTSLRTDKAAGKRSNKKLATLDEEELYDDDQGGKNYHTDDDDREEDNDDDTPRSVIDRLAKKLIEEYSHQPVTCATAK